MTIIPELVVVALTTAAVLRRREPAGTCAALAAAAYAFGAVSLRVAAGAQAGAGIPDAAVGAVPRLVVHVDAAFELAGCALAVGAALSAWRRREAVWGFLPSLAAGGAALAVAIELRRHAPAGGVVATAMGGLVLLAAGAGAHRVLSRPPSREGAVGTPSAGPAAAAGFAGATTALCVAGTLLAVTGPHLFAVLAGAMLAALSFALSVRARGGRSWPVVLLLVVPALLFAGYYMDVIAGPTGLSLGDLTSGPFSPAAEALLLPPLALAAAAFFSPWPLWRALPGPACSLVGVALLLRLGIGVLPDALQTWQTVWIPLAVVSLWAAAIASRPAHLVAAAAWAGCFAAEPSGAAGAWLLAGAATAIAAVHGFALRASRRVRDSAAALIAAAVAVGGMQALDGLLRSQVVYAVLVWAGVTVALMRSPAPARG